MRSAHMVDPKPRRLALVIGEHGSDWFAWADRLVGPAAHVMVVTSRPGESVGTFATRVREKVEELCESGAGLEAAALVAGPEFDPEVLAARTLVVRALSAAMQKQGRGTITLASAHGPDRAGRLAMASLAEVVGEAVRGSGVVVEHVPPRRDSGVFTRGGEREVA